MCAHCARGRTHLSRACVSMLSRPNHPNYSQIGFRVQTPAQGGRSCSLLPFTFLHKTTKSHSKPQLRWIDVGMWVLAAFCPSRPFGGRSKSKSTLAGLRRPGKWRSDKQGSEISPFLNGATSALWDLPQVCLESVSLHPSHSFRVWGEGFRFRV